MHVAARIAVASVGGIIAGVALLAGWITQPLLTSSATVVVPPANATALRRHVTVLSRDLHPRSARNHANLSAAGAYVAQELSRSGAQLVTQSYQVSGRLYSNYSVLFGPAEGERIVIGAHYDSFENTPGADDNASGVAGLIELARLLAARPPPRPVELVAYTLEEPPYFRTPDMGSARHAESLYKDGVRVRLMIALEMIGHFSDAPGSQTYPLPSLGLLYPDAGNFIAVVGALNDPRSTRQVKAGMRAGIGAEARLSVYSINAPALLTGVDFSDHLSYWARGFPAVMVTDTSFLRNRHYHESGDTLDTLDYARMAEVVRGVFAFVQTPPD